MNIILVDFYLKVSFINKFEKGDEKDIISLSFSVN